eukprot:g5389.t1
MGPTPSSSSSASFAGAPPGAAEAGTGAFSSGPPAPAPGSSSRREQAAADAQRFGAGRGSKWVRQYEASLQKSMAALAAGGGGDGEEAQRIRKVGDLAAEIIARAEKMWQAVREFEARALLEEGLQQARAREQVATAQLRHVRMVKPEVHHTALKANVERDLSTIKQLLQKGDNRSARARAMDDFQERVGTGLQSVEQDMEALRRRKLHLAEKEKDLVRIENQIKAQPEGPELERLLWSARDETTTAFVVPNAMLKTAEPEHEDPSAVYFR